jgi:hypothetical protein
LGYHARYEIQSTTKLRLRCLLPTLQGDAQESTVETSGITNSAASYGKVPERSIFNYPDKEWKEAISKIVNGRKGMEHRRKAYKSSNNKLLVSNSTGSHDFVLFVSTAS